MSFSIPVPSTGSDPGGGDVRARRPLLRRATGEEPLDERLPDPIVDRADGIAPEHEALLADSVGLALLVVLDTLRPAERLAYVFHDMFSVAFAEVGAIVHRSSDAARELASRGRRRIRDVDTTPDVDAAAQQEVVQAFVAAARDGDFDLSSPCSIPASCAAWTRAAGPSSSCAGLRTSAAAR